MCVFLCVIYTITMCLAYYILCTFVSGVHRPMSRCSCGQFCQSSEGRVWRRPLWEMCTHKCRPSTELKVSVHTYMYVCTHVHISVLPPLSPVSFTCCPYPPFLSFLSSLPPSLPSTLPPSLNLSITCTSAFFTCPPSLLLPHPPSLLPSPLTSPPSFHPLLPSQVSPLSTVL